VVYVHITLFCCHLPYPELLNTLDFNKTTIQNIDQTWQSNLWKKMVSTGGQFGLQRVQTLIQLRWCGEGPLLEIAAHTCTLKGCFGFGSAAGNEPFSLYITVLF
jgi:hypothetical protein